jgi:hypothetical protein
MQHSRRPRFGQSVSIQELSAQDERRQEGPLQRLHGFGAREGLFTRGRGHTGCNTPKRRRRVMRTIQHLITALLALHGAIHVLGFLKWAHLHPVPQLSGRTLVPLSPMAERPFAGLWATALLLLALAAGLRLLSRELWWAPALTGLVLSQALIVVSWHDAKFGTVLNVLLLLPALAGAAHTQFAARIDREVGSLLSAATARTEQKTVTAADLERLPPPVRRWLDQSGIVGRAPIRTVRLRQAGELRTAPGAAFLPATAEQYFTVDPPGFVWRVQARMFGVLPVEGRDLLAQGHGEMLIKAASLLPIVHARDEKIDHGSKLRFLGEIVWFPSGALAPYVSWERIDDSSARATMTSGTDTVSAVFQFDEQGRMVGLDAERYFGGGPGAKLTPWSVVCTDWRRFQGILVPTRGEVRWILPAGTFGYYRWEVVDVEFDRPELYGVTET